MWGVGGYCRGGSPPTLRAQWQSISTRFWISITYTYMYMHAHKYYNTQCVHCAIMIVIVLFLPSDWVWNGKSFIQVSKEWKMVSAPPHVCMHCIVHIAFTHTIQQSRSHKYFQGIWKSWGSMPLDLPSTRMRYMGIGSATPTRPLPDHSKFHGYDHCTSCLNIMEIRNVMHFSAAWFSWQHPGGVGLTD